MVSDKEFGYILSLCVGQPVAAAGMRVDEAGQIIEFVLDDPKSLLILP